MARLNTVLAGMLLAAGPCAFALNPALDVNQYEHTAWTVRDGFFKGAVQTIAQTPDGYLWIGTEFGLLRFDGFRAVPWEPPGDALPSDYIRRLLVTRDGRLWIGTRTGLATWKDGKLTRYPEFGGLMVTALLEDSQGTVWGGGLGVRSGRLCAFQNARVVQCYGEDGSLGAGVISLYEQKSNLWVGAATGLWRWKPDPPTLYAALGPTSQIQAMIGGDNGALLMALRSGIKQLVDGKAEAYPLPSHGDFRVFSLLRDRDGGLWFGTSGQGVLHQHRGRAEVFASADGLSSDHIYSLFEDREGNIWIATDDGLDRLRDLAVPTISVKQGLSSSTVWSVLAASDGSIWIGTLDGLNRWNDGQVTTYGKQSGLPADAAGSLFEDDRARIWASTRQGVAYFENGRFVRVSSVPGGIVHTIAGESDGSVWINDQDHGLFHVLNGRVVERIPWAELGRKDPVTVLVPDPTQGGLWLGFFQGGLVHFKDGKIRASYSGNDGLGRGFVSALQLDRDGTLWAATEGGLSRLKNGRVNTLNSKNGLPCDGVQWMLEDDAHSFWLYMPCGLARIPGRDLEAWSSDPKRTITTAVLDRSDGVRSGATASGYTPHAGKSPDGKLWFTTLDGLGVIDPRHLPINKLPALVHVEQVAADRKIYWQNLSGGSSTNLRLPPLVRDLQIDYTALSLAAPEKIRFKYKLEGKDRDWEDVGNRRQAFYNDLPPRNYRFRVAASNNSGVWNEAGVPLDFSIAPAYYQTAWFQAAIAAAVLALLWGLYRLRLYQVAREFNVRLEERVGERTRIARDLHDTLLQSFQGLMLRLQVVDELLPEGKAKEQLEQTLERADQAIAEGRSAVYDLRSSATITNDLAQAVKAVGDELATKDAAAFRLVVEGPGRELHPIIRDEVYRIAREALRNAFSHAHAHQIEVELTYGERAFRLRIRDDGEGIPAEILEGGRPGHYGLPGMRERARQIGGKLEVWSGARTGTEIELTIAGSIAYGTRADSPFFRLFRKKVG